MLPRAVFRFFRRMPADRRWIEKNLGTTQSSQPRRFRIPLVPTNADADFRLARLPRAKPKVPGGEIELLIEERVVRDVHLPILPNERSVRIEYRSGVVIKPCASFLKERCDDHHVVFARNLRKCDSARPRNLLG